MRLLIFIISIFFFTSCIQSDSVKHIVTDTLSTNKIILPGKFAVTDIQRDTCVIYDNSNIGIIRFKIGRFNDTSYRSHNWMHTVDYFVATENLKIKNGPIYKGNLIKTDINNKLVEYIYKVSDGEFAGDAHFSKDDSLLLFTVAKTEDNSWMNNLLIMDFKSKRIIKEIDRIGISPFFSLDESPWLYDGSSFIYGIKYEKDDNINKEKETAGIYSYNIISNQKKLLLPDAYFGICSPVDLKIAYKKEQSVYCYNLKDNSTRLVYKAGKKERVGDIHWTPDGKYIYMAFFVHHFLNIVFDSGERLIEVETGKEIPFQRINHGFQSYSWK